MILSFSSINTNGLRTEYKMQRVLNLCNTDIICLQETRWDNTTIDIVKKLWGGLLFYSNGTERARGVAILIKKHAATNIKQCYTDAEGRVVGIEFSLQKVLFKLFCVYAPNIEKDRVLFFESLKPCCSENCIFLGDMNVWMDRLDASRNTMFRPDVSRKRLLDINMKYNLIDKWRWENPDKREFSRRQIVLGELKQSRIDLCLVAEDIMLRC